MKNEDWLLEALVDFYHITESDVTLTRAEAAATDKSVIEVLIKSGKVTDAQVLQVKAAQFGMEVVDLRGIEIPRDVIAIHRAIGELAWAMRIIPLKKEPGLVTIATDDPSDTAAFDDLYFLLGCDIRIMVAPQNDIDEALKKYYSADEAAGKSHKERMKEIDAEFS